VAGLREHKKQATRNALSWAAVRLAVERGFDNVLVEDIAAEAGVSPRTFNNYFASKAEAIGARHLDRARMTADLLTARPADEPLWPALTAAVLSHAGSAQDAPDPQWTAGVRLMTSEPALLGEMLRAGAGAQRALTEAVALRTGTDPDRDMYPRLVAAAVGAAWQVATDRWANADPPVPLAPLMREALELLAAGLPEPTV
jgi:AcrR family transcriptional regulator